MIRPDRTWRGWLRRHRRALVAALPAAAAEILLALLAVATRRVRRP